MVGPICFWSVRSAVNKFGRTVKIGQTVDPQRMTSVKGGTPECIPAIGLCLHASTRSTEIDNTWPVYKQVTNSAAWTHPHPAPCNRRTVVGQLSTEDISSETVYQVHKRARLTCDRVQLCVYTSTTLTCAVHALHNANILTVTITVN